MRPPPSAVASLAAAVLLAGGGGGGGGDRRRRSGVSVSGWGAPAAADAYSYAHPTSSPLALDASAPVSTNPLVLHEETSHVTDVEIEGGGVVVGGIGPAVDPSTLKTYGAGLVALYGFESYAPPPVEGALNGEAGSTPCGLGGEQQRQCPNAMLTSNDVSAALSSARRLQLSPAGDDDVGSFFGPGRFGGSALRVSPLPHVTGDPASVGTFAQIPSPGSPFKRNQPARGMTGAAWIKFEGGAWSDGNVWERQFGNFDVSLRYGRCVACDMAGQDNTRPSVSHCFEDTPAAASFASSGWFHLACSYSGPDETFSLYLNGTLVASDSSVALPHDLFLHGDNQPFGLGNRPGTSSDPLYYAECCGNSAFEGLIDDFALWDRPLTDGEVLDLASSEVPLEPSPRIVLTTENVVRELENEPDHPSELLGREFEALAVTWTTASASPQSSSPDDAIAVEVSTDDGLNWCPVANGVPFSDLFHGDPDGQASCLFPSVTVKVRAIWTGTEGVVVLTGLSVDFYGESPLILPGEWRDVDVGMNAAGVNYYQSQWVFTDAFQSGGGSSWPAVRSGTDPDGWPLEIDPLLDDDGTYWITGRNIVLSNTRGNYPSGTYTLMSEGEGTIRVSWDSGEHIVESPCRYEFDVTVPTNSGVQVFVERSVMGNHVRNVRVCMPGFAPEGGTPYVPGGSVPTPPQPSPSGSTPTPAPIPAPGEGAGASPSPAVPPCSTCIDGLVGYWPFDVVADPILSSSDGSVVVRTTTPSAGGAGNDAYVTGSGSAASAAPPLSPDGRFGSALSVPLGTENFVQIFPSGLEQSAPAVGFAGSVWLKPASSAFSRGTVWDRMFGNFALSTEENNYMHCQVVGIDNIYRKVSYQLPPSLDPTEWIHAVCSYDGPTQTLKLFVDGDERAAGVAPLPEGKFRHDDGTPLGLGNKAGSVSDMGQFANEYHFVGDVDDFALWDRPLDTDEVRALFASGAAISDLIPAGPDSDADTSYCSTCLDGVVGHWTFDEIEGGDSSVVSSSDGAAVVVRGESPPSLSGAPATLTGDGSSPPLVGDGKFGRALDVPPGRANWANLFPSGLMQADPGAAGFAGSIWLRPAGNYFNQGTIWERMFSNFDLHTWSWNNYLRCRVRSSEGMHDIGHPMNGAGPLDPSRWFHAVCTYDPSTETLALYVDGEEVVSDAVTFPGGTFGHGDGQPLGIGNRAGSLSNPGQFAGDGHFIGAMDDFALWNRHLTADEIKSLYESGKPLLDQTPPEKDCVTCLDGIVGHYEFDETSGGITSSADGSVIVRGTSAALTGADATITGDGGEPPLVQDGRFGSALSIPPGKANWAQLFPSGLGQSAPASGFAASLWLRPADASFVQGGIFERMFGNFEMKTWSWNNYLRCGMTGSDGQNKDIGYSINGGGPMDTTKWIHAVCSYDGSIKKLSLFVDGEEKVSDTVALSDDKFRHGDGQPLGLGNRAGSMSNPGQFAGSGHFVGALDDFVLWGRPLTGEEVGKLFDSGKPVKLQGQDVPGGPVATETPTKAPTSSPTVAPTASPTSKAPTPVPSTGSPSAQPSPGAPLTPSPAFHPAYLDSLSSFSLVRFMDWGHTNSNQVSQWKHRNTPSSVSQTHSFTVTADITSIMEADATPFSGYWLAKVTTSSPHDLSTGQLVDLTGTDGLVTLDSGETVSFDISYAMVECLDETNFLVSYSRWGWDASTHNVQSFENGSSGMVSIRYQPGVSLEYQIELANTLGKDAWFNVPHLADDGYVSNMAQMINDTLAPGLKAYIEYSNEIWNWAPGFIQTRYAYNMASADGESRGDRHLVWYGKKCAHIFSIFDGVFGGRYKASERIVRVVAVQAGSGNVQLEFAGGAGASDALAIAPYFGGSLNAEVHGTPGWESLSTDRILDLARREVVDATLRNTFQSAAYAEQYGVKLIAYEGGQHMGGGGGCGAAGDCSNIEALQKKFQDANHHPRIKGLYRNMFKAWSIAGGNQTGVFAAFSHIGFDSKYGSWGALLHQMDDISIAWKYQAMTENIGN